jgi:hypothetical protein
LLFKGFEWRALSCLSYRDSTLTFGVSKSAPKVQ